MTRCGQPGHLTPSIPSGVFPGSLGETLAFTVRCPQSPLASAHRTNKPTLRTNLATQSHGLPLPQCLDQQSFSSSLGLCSPSIQTHRHHLLPTSPISSALPIPALPAVSEQPLLRQRIPFCLAWTAQRPARVRQQICAADFPRRASSCGSPRCRFFPLLASLPLPRPPVFFVTPRTINSPDSSPAPAADSADFVGAADSSTACCVRTAPVSSAHPLDEFSCLAWTAQRPARVRQAICASDLPRRACSLHKSALPIFPFGGMAATAPMSRPTVFLLKPWTIQSRDPGSAARSHPIPASSTPCP